MTAARQRLNDHLHAFCSDTDAYLAGVAHGPLAGLTFAAKDIFDVAGYVTGGGNPDWQATHAAASRTAWAVQVLVDAGATEVADLAVTQALRPFVDYLATRIGSPTTVRLAPEGLAAWSDQQQVLQGCEAWETAQDWIDRVNPRFSFEVTERYVTARAYTDADVAAARARREALRQRLDTVLTDDAVLCLPTTPTPAPRRGERISARRDMRARIGMLTCIAGTTGRPQISLPLAVVGGLPIGLSLLGARGADAVLLAFARDLATELAP